MTNQNIDRTIKMREISCRERFKRWASGPPFELSVERYPDDPEKYAWPGSYKDIKTDLAWQAWLGCWQIWEQALPVTIQISPENMIFGPSPYDRLTSAMSDADISKALKDAGIDMQPAILELRKMLGAAKEVPATKNKD